MDYKELYIALANRIHNLDCRVLDYDYQGFCSFLSRTDKAFIFVKPRLPYKEKLFVLAHEAGHLFTEREYPSGKRRMEWLTGLASEKEANKFAVKMLRSFGISSRDYYRSYKRALNKTKNRRKCWHE